MATQWQNDRAPYELAEWARWADQQRGTRDPAPCPACEGVHHIQHCPRIAALRDAPAGTNVRGLAACLEASHVK